MRLRLGFQNPQGVLGADRLKNLRAHFTFDGVVDVHT